MVDENLFWALFPLMLLPFVLGGLWRESGKCNSMPFQSHCMVDVAAGAVGDDVAVQRGRAENSTA